MRYQLFGQTGLSVSELALGAMTFGNNKWGADEATSAAIYAAYRDAGGNFLDTANEVYAEGRSEDIVGRLVAAHRDEVVISTKYTFHVPGTKNAYAGGGSESKRLDVVPLKAVDERSLAIARGVGELAAQIGRSSVAVALNWLRAKRGVIPLLGARALAQLHSNLTCLDFSLDADQLSKLDTLSAFSPGYPQSFIARLRPMASGGFYDCIDR